MESGDRVVEDAQLQEMAMPPGLVRAGPCPHNRQSLFCAEGWVIAPAFVADMIAIGGVVACRWYGRGRTAI